VCACVCVCVCVCQGLTRRSDSDEKGARRAKIRWVLGGVIGKADERRRFEGRSSAEPMTNLSRSDSLLVTTMQHHATLHLCSTMHLPCNTSMQ
jgi:hypothetical protein